MAVAYDTVSESHTGTTGNANADSFTWDHIPVGTPRGILVFVLTVAGSGLATSVSYGGVTMSAVSGATAADTGGEPGTVQTFFLGTGVLSGTRAVVVNRTNNATVMYAVAISVTAAGDTITTGTPVLLQEDGAYAVQAVNTGSVVAQRFAAGFYGQNNPVAPGTGSTTTGASGQIDFGSYTFTTCYETTPGSGSRNVGFTNATGDDRAAVHLAIAESPNINVSVTLVAMTMAQLDATVNVPVAVSCSLVALALDDLNATVEISADTNVSVTLVALVLVEQPVGVNAAISPTATVVGMTLAPLVTDVDLDVSVAVGLVAISLASFAATVDISETVNVNATSQAMALAAFDPTVNAVINAPAQLQALILSEQEATINAAFNLMATMDALTMNALATSVSVGINVPVALAELTLQPLTTVTNAVLNVASDLATLTSTAYAAAVVISGDINVNVTTVALALAMHDAVITGPIQQLKIPQITMSTWTTSTTMTTWRTDVWISEWSTMERRWAA